MENSYLQHSSKKIVPVYTDLKLNLTSPFEKISEKSSALIIITEDEIPKYYNLQIAQLDTIRVSHQNLEHFLKLFAQAPLQSTTPDSPKALWSKSKTPKVIQVLEIASNCSNLHGFIKNLYDLKLLQDFGDIYILNQNKGDSTAKQFKVGSKVEFQGISAEEFNEVFNHIKKSKQTSFASSIDKGNTINIPGTSLAQCFRFKSHNLILIATKNEFIPYGTEAIDDFNRFCDQFKLCFALLLEKESTLELENKLQETLKQLDTLQSHNENKNNFHAKRIELLGELLNTLRHELSNPLFGLQLSASIVTEELEGEDQDLCLQIQDSIEKAIKIINNFLWLYSETEEFQDINLKSLIGEIFTLSKSATKSIHKSILIDPKLHLKSNPAWLTQIFFNLIINSAQAMERAHTSKPSITIEVEIKDKKLCFKVTDNGPGIHSDKEHELFNPFYTTKDTGTGLGLAICRNLANKLEGLIYCAKNDNGAQFILELPYEDPTHRG